MSVYFCTFSAQKYNFANFREIIYYKNISKDL